MGGFIEIVPSKCIKYLNLNIAGFFQFFGSVFKVTDIDTSSFWNQSRDERWRGMADSSRWNPFHPSDHNGEMIYSLIKIRELSNTSRLDNGCNHATSAGWWWPGTHVSGQISPSPLPGPGNAQTHDHGNWVYWPLGRNFGRRVREGSPSLRQRALSSSCDQSAGGQMKVLN